MNFFKKLFNKSYQEQEEAASKDVKLALDDLFVHNFVNKGGKFLYCLCESEVTQNLKKILLENDWKSLFLLDTMLDYFICNQEVSLSNTAKKNTPIFTTCEHLIADNGDILFSSRQLGSTKLSEFTTNFIVFAKTSQLVKNSGQGLTGIKSHTKGSLPTNISAIKSYQLENNEDNFLNYGNNNAKNLYLLLLEDL